MPFDFKLSLSVSSSSKSRKGDRPMGAWADRALKKLQDTSSKERLDEELELVRHHKTVAGAEVLWDKLIDFIKTETDDFNRKKERDFFAISGVGDEIEVAAPELRLKLKLDLRTPSIDFTYLEPFPNREEKDSGEYYFRLNIGDVSIVDQYDRETPLSIETVGGDLLDPLVK
jgi:hypothetical protein